MRRAIIAALVVSGCSGLASKTNNPDAPLGNDASFPPDAPAGCTTFVDFSTMHPVSGAGMTVVATGGVSNGQTFAQYAWIVTFAGAPVTTTQVDQFGAVVQFSIEQPGPYKVHFEAGSAADCQATDTTLDVFAPGANTQEWRLRVVPPASAGAPPQEHLLTVTGGADNVYGTIGLDPGLDVTSTVADASGAPVTAYLRFVPEATPDVAIEAFSTTAGAFEARVQSGAHDVLIVPASSSYAPVEVKAWQPLTPALVVPAADTIGGTLLAPSGQPLAGARVALAIGGVPTTVGVTDANGAWTVLGHVGGAPGSIDATVVPSDASGLPRLTLSGATLDLTQPVTIRYASSIATVALGGVPVRASGAAAPGAVVTFTGALAGAGTVSAGTSSVTAGGAVQATATADASGLLPAISIVRAPITAVVAPSPAVEAVVAIDTTGGAPASIAAGSPATISGTIDDPTGAARANVRVSLTPTGALAAATLLVPAAVTDTNGRFAIPSAPGGHYAMSAVDLAGAYAELDVADVTAGDTGALALGKAIGLSGTLQVTGASTGVDGAALTLLCATCTGVARSHAVAAAVSSGGGMFFLAAPDPGTSSQ